MTSKRTDGGPAFPEVGSYIGDDKPHAGIETRGGMSLRDWFAGMAPDPPPRMVVAMLEASLEEDESVDALCELLTQWQYRHADAMLVTRERGNEEHVVDPSGLLKRYKANIAAK